MTKQQQFKLNMELSEVLANYLVTKPDILKRFSGSSYVIFPLKNDSLSKLNSMLVSDLISEGKRVVRVEQTEDSNNPWVFTPVN